MLRRDLNTNHSKILDETSLSELIIFSDSIESGSSYINEIFLYFYISILEKSRSLNINDVKSFKPNVSADKKNYQWIAAFISRGVNIPYRYRLVFYIKGMLYLVASFFMVLITSFILPIYVLFKFSRVHIKHANKNYHSLAVIRAPATYGKMQFLEEEGVRFLIDDLTCNIDNIDSLYAVKSSFIKISSLVLVPYYSILDYFKIFMDAKATIGFGLSGYVLHYYARRIAHKCNFEIYLNGLMKDRSFKTYYTGNKEDRFALLEKRLCKKYGVPSICIPHGLEYAYKMPGGLVGDDFYCTSANAKAYLEKLYRGQSINFHFDVKIAEKMFSRHIKSNNKRKIVFFPESREPEVNLKIMSFLVEEGFKVYVKLHIKDNLDNYSSIINNIELIASFDEAISNNICLARKSTVLVEALYNHSDSIAVLIDDRDKAYVEFMFPSLADKKILRVESFSRLKILLTSLNGVKESLDV